MKSNIILYLLLFLHLPFKDIRNQFVLHHLNITPINEVL